MYILQNIIKSNYYYQPSWVMVVIVLSVMLLGYLYSAFHSRFNLFLKAVFMSRYSAQASREERFLSHPSSLILSLNFVLVASLFVLQISSSGAFFLVQAKFTLQSFLLIAVLVFCVYAVKILVLRTLANVTERQELVGEYIVSTFLINQFLGIVLIPVIMFSAYGPHVFSSKALLLGVVFFLCGFIFRIGKGMLLVLEKRGASLFYLILYLCTLEILPLLVGIKLIEKLLR